MCCVCVCVCILTLFLCWRFSQQHDQLGNVHSAMVPAVTAGERKMEGSETSAPSHLELARDMGTNSQKLYGGCME